MKTLLCLDENVRQLLKKNALALKLNHTQFVSKLIIDFENKNDLTKKKLDIQNKIKDIQEKNKVDIQNLEKELLDIQELEKIKLKMDEITEKEYKDFCLLYAKRLWAENTKGCMKLCEQNAFRWGRSALEMFKDCLDIPKCTLSDGEYAHYKKG